MRKLLFLVNTKGKPKEAVAKEVGRKVEKSGKAAAPAMKCPVHKK